MLAKKFGLFGSRESEVFSSEVRASKINKESHAQLILPYSELAGALFANFVLRI